MFGRVKNQNLVPVSYVYGHFTNEWLSTSSIESTKWMLRKCKAMV